MTFKSVSRVMSVVLVACVVMGTTACGSKGNAATKPETASASKTDSTVSSEPIPLTLGRQTLQNVKLPEAAVKIVNLFYDSLKNDQKLLEKYPEVAEYVKTGVDGSARPFNIEVNTATSLMDEYSLLKQCLDGKKDISEVNISEVKSNFESITKYKEDAENADTTAWSKYHSRCKGVDLIQKLEDDGTFNWVTPVFPSTTPTMETNQSNLDKLEEETFIKIATGAVSADKGFDEFVSEWKSQGGDTICKEIADSLNK